MAEKNEKWIMFRNFMHNDLGITKADIREWIDDAIKEQVKLIVNNTYKNTDIKSLIEKEIKNQLYNDNDIKNAIIDKIKKSMFFVDVEDDGDTNKNP